MINSVALTSLRSTYFFKLSNAFSIAFTGQNCATQLTNCERTACLNSGVCIAKVANDGQVIGEHCECPPYYTGDFCQTHFDPCANKCQNNGACQSSYIGNGEYKTTCSCTKDFTGENCTNVKCKLGYAGDRCEIDLDLCKNSPCHNGGTCEDHGSNFTCQCPPGYSGHDCSCDANACGRQSCLCTHVNYNYAKLVIHCVFIMLASVYSSKLGNLLDGCIED